MLEEDRRRIRDRLLQRIKDSSTNPANKDDDDDSQSDVYLDKHHNWAQQIAYEDTHLGGFRRIMPCPNEKNRYQKFYVQQNQLSVYSETAASKRREECSKQQRIDLEEKFKHNQHILKQFRFSKNLTGEDDIVKKKKAKKNKRNYFKPDDINESDERDRCTSMAQREYIIKTSGLLQGVSLWALCESQQLSFASNRFTWTFIAVTYWLIRTDESTRNCSQNLSPTNWRVFRYWVAYNQKPRW